MIIANCLLIYSAISLTISYSFLDYIIDTLKTRGWLSKLLTVVV